MAAISAESCHDVSSANTQLVQGCRVPCGMGLSWDVMWTLNLLVGYAFILVCRRDISVCDFLGRLEPGLDHKWGMWVPIATDIHLWGVDHLVLVG